MIPTSEPPGQPRLPAEATFWTPKRSDIDPDEGFGYFRDVWTIMDVRFSWARETLAHELKMVEAVGDLAQSDVDFDRVAHVVESGFDDEDDTELSSAERAALELRFREVDPNMLGGLELGVAGLVHALAAVKIFPAASCRGHPGEHVWSSSPVVFFAANEFRARALESLAQQTDCVFCIDEARADLIVVGAPSIVNMMNLGDLVLAKRDSFVQRRTNKSLRKPQEKFVQLHLFDY